MRLKAKRFRAGSSSSRFRLILLLATVAAFLVVGVAQASAAEVYVTVEGTGAGEVNSTGENPFGYELPGEPPIECAYSSPGPQEGACEGESTYWEEGEADGIGMNAIPAEGSEFTEWQVNFEGEGPFGEGRPVGCALTSFHFCAPYYEAEGPGETEGDVIEVTAVFNAEGGPSGPPLTTIIEEGQGTVVSNPAGIECTGNSGSAGPSCTTEEIEEGTVTLTASPAAGYAFSKWKGCATHVGLTCTVTLNEARTVGVYFVATTSVAIEKAGSGAGTAKAGALGCDESCSGGAAAVQTGKTVKVTTKPAKGSEEGVITGGTGSAEACNGESHCEFTAGADQTLTVTFAAKPMKTLTLDITGPAAYKGKVKGKALLVKGLVKSSFSCGANCSTEESFFEGDEVELTASASTGYTFAGWTIAGGATGNCTGTTSPCKLPVDADKTIEAEFK